MLLILSGDSLRFNKNPRQVVCGNKKEEDIKYGSKRKRAEDHEGPGCVQQG